MDQQNNVWKVVSLWKVTWTISGIYQDNVVGKCELRLITISIMYTVPTKFVYIKECCINLPVGFLVKNENEDLFKIYVHEIVYVYVCPHLCVCICVLTHAHARMKGTCFLITPVCFWDHNIGLFVFETIILGTITKLWYFYNCNRNWMFSCRFVHQHFHAPWNKKFVGWIVERSTVVDTGSLDMMSLYTYFDGT
jgi:hypothetical protein